MSLPAKCQMGGDACNSTTLYLHARCHPRGGLDVMLETTSRMLRVLCKDCGRMVFECQLPEAEQEEP